ncbi:MAG: hypothetical protein RMJ84_01105 [Sandaracinaceae bacterium]|nr:hypothetical protein [Sandaracinaceae bacterium]
MRLAVISSKDSIGLHGHPKKNFWSLSFNPLNTFSSKRWKRALCQRYQTTKRQIEYTKKKEIVLAIEQLTSSVPTPQGLIDVLGMARI